MSDHLDDFKVFSIRQVARILGINEITARRMVARGVLKTVPYGGSSRGVTMKELKRWRDGGES